MTTKECDVNLNYASKVESNYHLDRPHKLHTQKKKLLVILSILFYIGNGKKRIYYVGLDRFYKSRQCKLLTRSRSRLILLSYIVIVLLTGVYFFNLSTESFYLRPTQIIGTQKQIPQFLMFWSDYFGLKMMNPNFFIEQLARLKI